MQSVSNWEAYRAVNAHGNGQTTLAEFMAALSKLGIEWKDQQRLANVVDQKAQIAKIGQPCVCRELNGGEREGVRKNNLSKKVCLCFKMVLEGKSLPRSARKPSKKPFSC